MDLADKNMGDISLQPRHNSFYYHGHVSSNNIVYLSRGQSSTNHIPKELLGDAHSFLFDRQCNIPYPFSAFALLSHFSGYQ